MNTTALRRNGAPVTRLDWPGSKSSISDIKKQRELSEVDQILYAHVCSTSSLFEKATEMEQEWLEFAKSTSPQHLPGALEIIQKLDRLRSRMFDQMIRVAELQRPKMNIQTKEMAVVVAPDMRDIREAK